MSDIVVLSSLHDRINFDCSDNHLNTFLKRTARQHMDKGISRTYVLAEGSKIIGFYALTLCEVMPHEMPSHLMSKYPSHTLPAVRLARMAVDKRWQNKGCGKLLITHAIYNTFKIAELSGIVGLFVDAKNETVRNFYIKYGFIPLSSDSLYLVMPLETIKKLVPVQK